MPKINQKTLLELPITLPSIEEQKNIVKIAKELLNISDRVLSQYKEAVLNFTLLEKAILSEAFQIDGLQSYNESLTFKEIEDDLQEQKVKFANEQILLKKNRTIYINRYYLKSNEIDKIKTKIKEITLEDFSSNEFLSAEDMNTIRKKIGEIVVDFDYDDFWAVFQELTNDAIGEDLATPFFIAVQHEGIIQYKINSHEASRN
ncbi:hypothetical protein GJR95_11440 [Spirosoma endbachense]|uniref:Type I restriction modification DNA specificity domain-containing protein n=1 Tax=Spirosoma endbachense TaxID=2666025 RepID=A0A6P1VT32_9BACT|nr:hypothetical protein GJR95_11440 [Spirosoma endbachense]